MLVPSLDEATALLEEASVRNPTPWVEHSKFVAQAAGSIAELDPDLDGTVAQILGLLHDIGRQEGITDMRHALDGYTFLKGLGYEGAARICLTHSFPSTDLMRTETAAGTWDCSEEERRFVDEYLSGVQITQYDRLIQLCDALALPSGFCRLEKRLVDVVLRRGFNEFTVLRWRAYLGLLESFGRSVGRDVYDLLGA